MGAHPILKSKVIKIKIILVSMRYLKLISISIELIGKDKSKLIWLIFKVPKQPYISDTPNTKKPEIKYFKPASVEKTELRLKVDKI